MMEQFLKTKKKKGILLLFFALGMQLMVYGPFVGKGFVTDDYEWIRNVVDKGKIDWLGPFDMTTGFFRPMVGFSFALQYFMHGMNPAPYGWFNLILHIANILLVFLLLSSFDSTKPYAAATAFLFGLNGKCNSMAVGWISGRTSLLFGFFLLLSFYLLVKQYKLQSIEKGEKKEGFLKKILCYIPASLAYFGALLSKETAAAAPFFVFLSVLLVFNKKTQGINTLADTKKKKLFLNIKKAFFVSLIYLIPLGLYFILRMRSNAFFIFDARSFYRYEFSLGLPFKNLIEHFIRGGILDIYLLFLVGLIFILLRLTAKKIFNSNPTDVVQKSINFDNRITVIGITWFIFFLLPVLFLPVRSDLYGYIPQIGIHLISVIILAKLWNNMPSGKRKQIVVIPVILLLISWTVYLFTRADSYSEAAKESYKFSQQVVPAISKLKPGEGVIILDMDASKRFHPSKTIGYGFRSFLDLYFPGKELSGKIVLPDEIEKKINMKKNEFLFSWKNERLEGPFNNKEAAITKPH